MKNAIKIIFLFFIISGADIFAIDKSKIIAFPVPFNPNQTVLKIEDRNNTPGAVLKIEIMDINGDQVHSGSGSVSSQPYKWNGRNDKGNMVKPGFYIVKVTVEVPGSTTFERKLIRILVKN